MQDRSIGGAKSGSSGARASNCIKMALRNVVRDYAFLLTVNSTLFIALYLNHYQWNDFTRTRICSRFVLPCQCMAMVGQGPTSRKYDFRELNLVLLIIYFFTSFQLVLKTMIVSIHVADTLTRDIFAAARELGGVRVTLTSTPFLLKKVCVQRTFAFVRIALAVVAPFLATSVFVTPPWVEDSKRTSSHGNGGHVGKPQDMSGARTTPSSVGKKGKSRKARQMESAKKAAVQRAHRLSIEAIKAGDALKEAEEEFRIASGANTPMAFAGSRFAELLSPMHNSNLPSPNRSQLYTVDDTNSGLITAALSEKLAKLDDGSDHDGVGDGTNSDSVPISPPTGADIQTVLPEGEIAENDSATLSGGGTPRTGGGGTPKVPALAALKLRSPGSFTPLSSMPASPKVIAAEAVYRQKLTAAAEALAATLEFVEADEDVNAFDSSGIGPPVQYTKEELLCIRESPLVPRNIDENYEYYVLHSTIVSLNREVTTGYMLVGEESSRFDYTGEDVFDGDADANGGGQLAGYMDQELSQTYSEYNSNFNANYGHVGFYDEAGEHLFMRPPSRDSRAESEGRWDEKRDTPIHGKLYEDRYSESMGDYNARRGHHNRGGHHNSYHGGYHHHPAYGPGHFPDRNVNAFSGPNAGVDRRYIYNSAPDPGRHRARIDEATYGPMMTPSHPLQRYPGPGLGPGERPNEHWQFRHDERRPSHEDRRFEHEREFGGVGDENDERHLYEGGRFPNDDRSFSDGRHMHDDFRPGRWGNPSSESRVREHPKWRSEERRFMEEHFHRHRQQQQQQQQEEGGWRSTDAPRSFSADRRPSFPDREFNDQGRRRSHQQQYGSQSAYKGWGDDRDFRHRAPGSAYEGMHRRPSDGGGGHDQRFAENANFQPNSEENSRDPVRKSLFHSASKPSPRPSSSRGVDTNVDEADDIFPHDASSELAPDGEPLTPRRRARFSISGLFKRGRGKSEDGVQASESRKMK